MGTQQDSLNEFSRNRDRSASGLRDLSVELLSGAGIGNVNAVLNNPGRMDYKLQSDLYAKLNEDNALNTVNIEQRQRIFEDVIIQRIKVI